ncbi:hypothetical protein PROVRETT_09246 [Providencia rettgeri DSM 1131]|nr:hypothetical protein PROVRETT_09246 [Providencia rettgeri DSM 1131]
MNRDKINVQKRLLRKKSYFLSSNRIIGLCSAAFLRRIRALL